MDITERNRRISDWNGLAAFACRRAQELENEWYEQIEDHVGMSGVRPIGAAWLTHPTSASVVASIVIGKPLRQEPNRLPGRGKPPATGPAVQFVLR